MPSLPEPSDLTPTAKTSDEELPQTLISMLAVPLFMLLQALPSKWDDTTFVPHRKKHRWENLPKRREA